MTAEPRASFGHLPEDRWSLLSSSYPLEVGFIFRLLGNRGTPPSSCFCFTHHYGLKHFGPVWTFFSNERVGGEEERRGEDL